MNNHFTQPYGYLSLVYLWRKDCYVLLDMFVKWLVLVTPTKRNQQELFSCWEHSRFQDRAEIFSEIWSRLWGFWMWFWARPEPTRSQQHRKKNRQANLIFHFVAVSVTVSFLTSLGKCFLRATVKFDLVVKSLQQSRLTCMTKFYLHWSSFVPFVECNLRVLTFNMQNNNGSITWHSW